MLTTVEELDIPQFKNNFDKASEFYWNNGFLLKKIYSQTKFVMN